MAGTLAVLLTFRPAMVMTVVADVVIRKQPQLFWEPNKPSTLEPAGRRSQHDQLRLPLMLGAQPVSTQLLVAPWGANARPNRPAVHDDADTGAAIVPVAGAGEPAAKLMAVAPQPPSNL